MWIIPSQITCDGHTGDRASPVASLRATNSKRFILYAMVWLHRPTVANIANFLDNIFSNSNSPVMFIHILPLYFILGSSYFFPNKQHYITLRSLQNKFLITPKRDYYIFYLSQLFRKISHSGTPCCYMDSLVWIFGQEF